MNNNINSMRGDCKEQHSSINQTLTCEGKMPDNDNNQIIILCVLSFFLLVKSAKDWKDKPVDEYTDADYDNLYEEWEENDDEEIPPDELPYGHPDRPQPPLSFSDKQPMMTDKATMIFVTLNGEPTNKETEELTLLWEMGLYNNHIHTTRFLIEDDRVMFTVANGAMAGEVKDYLTEQERVEFVEIDSKIYPGAYSDIKKHTEL